VVDYIVQETKAKRILGFSSFSMPNSVFVNEDNLVDLPKMEIFHIRGKRDILLLTGDYQPVNEESAYLLLRQGP
jgi:proteasome assembly chaperone (PAC2) family protein